MNNADSLNNPTYMKYMVDYTYPSGAHGTIPLGFAALSDAKDCAEHLKKRHFKNVTIWVQVDPKELA